MRSLNMNRNYYGDGQRLLFQENELKNAAIVPNPVEYEDIDNAFYKYFTNNLVITDEDGKKFDTYTFFSSQRFSEFSQTWGHDDEDGNLLMNFFTITRENNPNWGNLYGGSYNIPGNNRFTVLMRDIVDDTGVECYEITSMSQPLQTDINYRYSIVTAKFKYLNEFNVKINSMFSSRQCYLCVNGHFMPMTLENISDITDYTIDGRKFYSQTADITLMSYIIPKDDIKVNIVPKRKKVTTNLKDYNKSVVTMDYEDDSEESCLLKVKFSKNVSKTTFTLEDKCRLELVSKDNANKVVMLVNGEETNLKSGFVKICPNDEITIKIVQPNRLKSSELVFKCDLI